jgi:DNA polymerase III subunit gamma/tau
MYQVIARKYRPQTFGELIGQEHVKTTLENAITSARLAHGYIFSGQRGTGKTTVARILARCLNCIQGPTITPCGICASCLEITAGNSPDVIEIDAASNRGINEMRELRDNVRYQPARDRYKVFIIDEAHQITIEGFNALLKTLEEPPEWAVFMMCTTESHKIPNTIASRCQQFNFRSVEFSELVGRMQYIAREEGIEADAETFAVIAHAGEGSVRDSLSALDQAIACCGKTLNVEDVRALLGVFAVDSLRAVAEAVLEQSGQRMLEIVQELERSGQSLQHYVRELARYWRNLLVARITGKRTPLIPASESEQQALLDTAIRFSEEDLTRYLNLTLDLYRALQFSLQPRLHLELGLIKLVQAGRLQSIEDALAGLGATAAASQKSPANPAPLSATTRGPAPRPSLFQSRVAPAVVNPPAPTAPGASPIAKPASPLPTPSVADSPLAPTGDLKTELADALAAAGLDFSADAIRQSEVVLQGSDLSIISAKTFAMALKDPGVARTAAAVLGKPVRIKLEVSAEMTAAAPAAQVPAVETSDFTERALSHPGVKKFQELFPDAQVRKVRNLNERG